MFEEKSHVGMSLCYFCNQPKEILLNRRLRDSLPREAVYNKQPCDECQKHMKEGVIFISVRDGEQGDNPYRTGGWVVVSEQAVERIIVPHDLAQSILKQRVAFVPDSAWIMMGLPELIKRKSNETVS